MARSFDGEWNGYTFELISKDNYPSVIKHLEDHFHEDEPLAVIMGNSAPSYRDLDRYTSKAMDEGLSIAAYDKGTQKIAGVFIVTIARKNQTAHSDFDCESEEQATILRFLEAVEGEVDIFEKYGVEEFGEFLLMAVDPEFRRDGLAMEFIRRAFVMLKEMGVNLTAGSVTSPAMRIISERLGYEEVSRKYFRDIQDSKGRFVCPNAGDDEFVARLVLRL